MLKGHNIKARANLWVNLYDDLAKEPVMSVPIDTSRDDLTNIREEGGKRLVYIRGNVSQNMNCYLATGS